MSNSKVILVLFCCLLVASILFQTPASAQQRKISPSQLNNYAGQIVVARVEKKIGHRLDWKRRQQLVNKAKIMSDTIDRSNKEFASEVQQAFHMSSNEIDSLNSRTIAGRMYGGEALVKARIAQMRRKKLTKYEEKQVSQLVSQRNEKQKRAREKMANEIKGTIGMSYEEALSMVSPRSSRVSRQDNLKNRRSNNRGR